MHLLDFDFWERAVRLKDLLPIHGVCMEPNAQIFSWIELGCDCEPQFFNLMPWSPAMRLASFSWPVATLGTAQEDFPGLNETTPCWGEEGEMGICVALFLSQVSTAVSINLRALTSIFSSRRHKIWPTPFPKHQNEPWFDFVYSVK